MGGCIFWPPGVKKVDFLPFLAHCGPSAHHYGPSSKKKKFHKTFEDMVKLFYFMTFIPKLHILAIRGKKSGFFTIFGQMVGLRPTPVGLRPNPAKTKKVHMTFQDMVKLFFS